LSATASYSIRKAAGAASGAVAMSRRRLRSHRAGLASSRRIAATWMVLSAAADAIVGFLTRAR
jgi:hypothetical protein